jgi:hypothetical protein
MLSELQLYTSYETAERGWQQQRRVPWQEADTLCAQTNCDPLNHIFKFCAYTYESNTAQTNYFCYVLYDSYLLSDNHFLLISQKICFAITD